MKLKKNKKIFIQSTEYIYRVEHLTLEGTCSKDHGPRNVKIKNDIIVVDSWKLLISLEKGLIYAFNK